jgi:hypothetical protein
MKDVWGTHIKPNLQIMDIEENVQAKVIHNIFNKLIAENLRNVEKVRFILVHESFKTPNRQDEKRTSLRNIKISILNMQSK